MLLRKVDKDTKIQFLLKITSIHIPEELQFYGLRASPFGIFCANQQQYAQVGQSIHDVPVMICIRVTPPSGYGLSMQHDHYSLSAVPSTTDTKAMGNRQAAIWEDLYPNIQHCLV